MNNITRFVYASMQGCLALSLAQSAVAAESPAAPRVLGSPDAHQPNLVVSIEHHFDFTDLGSLGGGQSVAMDLNDHGQIVGWSLLPGDTYPHAFLWENGTMTPLGRLAEDEQSVARAINNHGMIIGTSERDVVAGYGVYHAVEFIGSSPIELPNLGGTWSMAHDVNDLGQIAGFGTNTFDWEVAVIWERGGVTDIGFNSPRQRTRGVGINNISTVVGSDYTPMQGGERAWMYNRDWTDIGGTTPFANSGGNAINDANVIAGYMATPDGAHATMWVPSRAAFGPGAPLPTIVDLGNLPDFDRSEALDINNDGQVVGLAQRWTETGAEARAIFYDGQTLIDLNDLLPEGFDGVLWEAHGINDHGDIVATALMNDSTWHAFLMSPVPDRLPEDVNDDGVVDHLDYLMVIDALGNQCEGCPEDVNGDGVVDHQDLTAVLIAWLGPPSFGVAN